MSYTNVMSIADFLPARQVGLRERIAIWRKRADAYRATVRELSAITDRELADIGLHRANIQDVAQDAARLAVRG
ncbi:MAG: DUF1127 domain-containing protein [Rhodobacteraceae bacterium]|nr:DUF1127 domain-containing protein [Paracoccaceae bacterium]